MSSFVLDHLHDPWPGTRPEGFGVFCSLFCSFFLLADGGEGAKQYLAEVGQDGGAARGDAVLNQEDGDLGEEGVNAGGGLESGEQAEEGGGEVFVAGAQELAPIVAETQAGGGVQDRKLAAAAFGRVVTATVRLLGSGLGQGWRLAHRWLGQGIGRGSFRKSVPLLGGNDKRSEFAGSGWVVDKARVNSWLMHFVPRFGGLKRDTPSVAWERVRKCKKRKGIGERRGEKESAKKRK